MKPLCNEPVPPRFAAIDIGSHTVRLLIAGLENTRRLIPLYTDRRITRLARGFQRQQLLQPQPVEKTIETLQEYNVRLARYKIVDCACGATGVVRRAENADQFLGEIKRRTGIRVDLLSERTEAHLSAKGTLSVMPPSQTPIICFDLGGSSTELIVIDPKDGRPLMSESVFVGAATVTERFLAQAPAARSSIEEATIYARSKLRATIERAKEALRSISVRNNDFLLVGSAGTVTTLAAIHLEMVDYVPYRVNGKVLEQSWIVGFIGRVRRMTLEQRRAIVGLEPGREDILLGGVLIVNAILDLLHHHKLIVTDAGLLEGLLLEAVERNYRDREAFGPLASPLTWRWETE